MATTFSSVPSAETVQPMMRLSDELTKSWVKAVEFVEESEKNVADVMRNRQTDRIRYATASRVRPRFTSPAQKRICATPAPHPTA